jgi:hypothetical protein
MLITKGLAAALSLASPGAGIDDGNTVTIVSIKAFAYLVTAAANAINGNRTVLTFGPAAANLIALRAFNGIWWVLANTGVALL